MPRPRDPSAAPARAHNPTTRGAGRRVARAFPAALLAVVAACGGGDKAERAADWQRVELVSAPQRIVPSSARALEFVAELVGPERLAGVPEQGFEYATLGPDEARFAALPRFYAFLAEPVLALAPDLVVGDPWQPGETNQRLREAGVPVVVLPETVGWRDGAEVLLQLGRLLGEADRARDVVAQLEQRVGVLEAGAERRAGLRALAYSNFGSQGFSAGSRTTIDEVIGLAGLTNAVAEAGRSGHVPLGFEELLVLDPDVIVVSAPLHTTVGHAGDRGGASEKILLSEPSLASLRAVRQRRIVALSPGLYASASHRVVEAAEALAAAVDALGASPGRATEEPPR